MRRLVPALLPVLAAFVFAGVAAADSRTAKDARGDTRGSHYPGAPYFWSPSHDCWITDEAPECGENDYFDYVGHLLDIASVSHGHKGAQLVHRVTMARNWKNSLLSPAQGGQLSLYFNLNANAAFERRLDVFLRRGKPAAAIRSGSRTVGSAAVSRPNARTIEIRVARTTLGRGRLTYRWFAFAGIVCKRKHDRCGDRSPNATLLAHRLR